MKVAELIAELSELNPNAEVYFRQYTYKRGGLATLELRPAYVATMYDEVIIIGDMPRSVVTGRPIPFKSIREQNEHFAVHSLSKWRDYD